MRGFKIKWSFILIFSLFFVITIVYAANFESIVTPTLIDEDTNILLNFIVNNTDSSVNITQVNIVLPNTNFSFITGTNETSSSNTSFSNTTTILSWTNTTSAGFIQNGTAEYFWFKVTAPQPGDYNFTVTTLDTAGAENSTNVSITMNDTTNPSVSTIQPTTGDEDTSINFNATVSDNVEVSSCNLYINGLNNGSMTISGEVANRIVAFANSGTYRLVANCSDAAGNINDTSATTITINDTYVPPKKAKNTTKKLELIPGVGLRNNTKLQAAIEKVLAKGKMSEQAKENLLRLSASITSDLEVTREFKAEQNKSRLSIKIKYKGNKTAKNFIVYDIVPKTFANSSDLIKVIAAGATVEIINKDPEYLFTYSEVSPDQDLEIIYEVSGEKDAGLINDTSVEFYTESLEEIALDEELPPEEELPGGLPPEEEKVEEPEEKSKLPITLIIVAIAIIIALGGLGYYFGVYKKETKNELL